MKALITRKLGMTTAIDKDGLSYAMTLLKVNPNTVIGYKTYERDGYQAIVIGSDNAKRLPKSTAGQLKGAKVLPKVRREFKIIGQPKDESLNVGQSLRADVFSIGDNVDLTGLAKGKGWAGTIKRHNFHRGRKTHGGRSYRRPGSIGSMYPQHVLKGSKMAGQLGANRVSVKNLRVALVDNDLGVIGVSGAVPGPKKSIVLVREAL